MGPIMTMRTKARIEMVEMEVVKGVTIFRAIIRFAIRDLNCYAKCEKCIFKIVTAETCEREQLSIQIPNRQYGFKPIKEFEIEIDSPELAWILNNSEAKHPLEWEDKYNDYVYGENRGESRKEYGALFKRDEAVLYEKIKNVLEN
jgi:hypothetical protein